MKFAERDLKEEIDTEIGNQIGSLIILADNTDVNFKSHESYNLLDKEDYTVVAQAISLDIRGDFGFFLNKRKDNRSEYTWTGNLFHISVQPSLNVVKIVESVGSTEEITYNIPWVEWEDALMHWKQFYLERLGFLYFKKPKYKNPQAMNHVVGVLLLTFDQMAKGICEKEMITEAIRRCSDRYGISSSVLYRDCKKVFGVATFEECYILMKIILEEESVEQIYDFWNYFNRYYYPCFLDSCHLYRVHRCKRKCIYAGLDDHEREILRDILRYHLSNNFWTIFDVVKKLCT